MSSTACSAPPALLASQRISPESLIPTASVRVKPVPEGISVLRFTNPLVREQRRRVNVYYAAVAVQKCLEFRVQVGIKKDFIVGTDRLLREGVGQACAEFHDRTLRNVKSKRIQCDEIWPFCYEQKYVFS
jgi:hypothetical protein